MFGWFKKRRIWESPVGDPDKIDIVGARRDGGVDLLIVVARPLKPDKQTVDVVSSKLRGYCRYVKSSEFRQEFGKPATKRVRIGLRSNFEIPDEFFEVIGQIREEENPPAEIAVFYEDPK